jgi:hypothetical protein
MAVTRMRFTGSGNGTHYIDLAKAMSLQERKLHRQKKIYTVYGGFFVDTPATGQVSRANINTAPNTWVTRNAVNRGFRIWKRMIAETVKSVDGLKTGKYSDFKVYLNNNHGAGPLLPVDAAGNNLYLAGPEWDYSTLTSADPGELADGTTAPADQFELNIVGHRNPGPVVPDGTNNAGWTRVGLVESWLNTRPTPHTNLPTDTPDGPADPLANLFDAGDVDDDRILVIESEGDQAPYDEAAVFGMVSSNNTSDHNLQRQSVVTTTEQMPTGPVHGFQALCGLVQVEVTANGTWELVLDVETVGEAF